MRSLFAATAIVAGALAGFVLGVSVAGFAALVGIDVPAGMWPLVSLSVGALAFDVAHVRFGRLRPLALHRQVPKEWGKLLSAPVVAGLYGARLGVGPLTMLTTWLWWAAMIGAGAISVWAAVAAGAVFGATRVIVNELAARQIRVGGLPAIERLGAMSRRSWITVDGSTLVGLLVVVLVASGCVASNDVVASDEVEVQGTSQTARADAIEASSAGPDGTGDTTTAGTGDGVSERSEEEAVVQNDSASEPDASAQGAPTDESAATQAIWQPSNPDELSSALIQDVAWFNRLTEPGADLYLNLDAASERQPDPTEERPLLETRGFLGGWSRVFRNDTQDVVVAQVYEFQTAGDAAFYLEDGFITLTGHGAELFDIESLDGVRGFRLDGADEIGPIVNYGLAYVEQNRWYLLTLTGDPQTATLDILVSAIEAQLQVTSE